MKRQNCQKMIGEARTRPPNAPILIRTGKPVEGRSHVEGAVPGVDLAVGPLERVEDGVVEQEGDDRHHQECGDHDHESTPELGVGARSASWRRGRFPLPSSAAGWPCDRCFRCSSPVSGISSARVVGHERERRLLLGRAVPADEGASGDRVSRCGRPACWARPGRSRARRLPPRPPVVGHQRLVGDVGERVEKGQRRA